MKKQELAANIQKVKDEVEQACLACGRDPAEVKILPVTKFVSEEVMHWAQEEGFSEFGENYVQHLLAKNENFSEIRWHLIGHLQRNKVKSIIAKLYLIQSLDNQGLLHELEKACRAQHVTAQVLIQVNIGREPQKSGVLPEDYEALRDAVLKSDCVRLRGLMAVPPAGEDPEPYFAQMQAMSLALREISPEACELSMGMSRDYACAIAHGSTMIRVGTALFGARPLTT